MRTPLLPLLLTFLFTPLLAEAVVWYDGQHAVTYHIEGETDLVVGTAVEMFRGDMLQVTGLEAVAVTSGRAKSATLQLLQLDRATRRQRARWQQQGVATDTLLAHPDAFQIVARDGQLWLAGGNGRGVAYALLELSRRAGVSPWVWWGDVTPERQKRLDFEGSVLEVPSVTYRGIFINDEDWSTRPWSTKNFDPTGTPGLISAITYKEIFKLLLRLRANLIWPAMHEGTVAFYQVPGTRATADSCGIVVGTSHCEPLMRNNVGEWDTQTRGRYNYLTNKSGVQQYWTERLEQSGSDENIYTIGMRGIHDGPMEGVKGLDQQTTALQEVIDDQRALMQRYVNQNVADVPQIFVPYKEVLQVMEHGLRVPDDVTLVWCDDNYGYITRLPDSLQQQRSGGHGLYYHLSYWGRPHDHLWLSCTQPGLIYEELSEAYRHHVRRLWVANVHDPKVAAYPLELFLDMAWNVGSVSPHSLDRRQKEWLSRTFTPQLGDSLAPVMREFYRLVGIRRPEFMGWCQNELDKKVYPRGLSPVRDTEFSFTEFGDEADRYLDTWRRCRNTVLRLRNEVPGRLQDAYFAHIIYPVCGAADMSIKLLEAQRARALAADTLNETCCDSTRRALMTEACQRSLAAYGEIEELTKYYNDSMAGGKWRGLMDAHPRTQLVFNAPTLPACMDSVVSAGLDEACHRSALLAERCEGVRVGPYAGDSRYVARDAAHYTCARGEVSTVEQLGHSMQAVAMERGAELSYDFETAISGPARLTVALIPTHPLDRGDVRLSVQVDGGEPQVCSIREGFRTEPWKLNVLRAQALRTVEVNLPAGRHTLTLRALDEHVVVDQWILDYVTNRKYYVISPF